MPKIFRGVTSVYKPKFARAVVYMLQATEYDTAKYLSWLYRVFDFGKVMHRRTLVLTRPAKMLLRAMYAGMLIQIVFGVWLGFHAWHIHHSYVGWVIIALFLASTPVVWAQLIVAPLVLGRWFITKPGQWFKVRSSAKVFANHSATKIAIAGSYGKTTTKEILLTVLSQGKKVAATPANENVAISHAQFAEGLKGDEDILIIEYGEGGPGDIARFAKATHPNIGVVTGLAPAHLDKYKTLAAAGEDIFSLANYLDGGEMYVNEDSKESEPFIHKSFITYGSKKIRDWKVSDVDVKIEGLSFKMKKGKRELAIKSNLVGEHLIGPLVLAIYMADKAGLSEKQIQEGVSSIMPFEHRMQARPMNGGWLIDDTYNGNIDGMEAGLALLAKLPAKRKIYVTPGLVDQGRETESVHVRLGEAIAKAAPDLVVLMKHAVTNYIVEGLEKAKFKGETRIEDDPLDFYNNLDKFIAAGDLVMMQNDWPDQYE